MGRPRNLKLVIGSAVCFLSVCAAVVGAYSVATLAKYKETKSAGQLVSRSGIAPRSYFLNANVWNTGTDNSGNPVDAVYYMWIITGAESGHLISPSKHVTPTVSSTLMDLYVFEYEYDWVVNTRSFVFIRANPETSITSFTTWPTSAVWNQTCDIPYSSERNYYCIKGWEGATGKKSEYEYNRIDKSGNTLSWGNPSGSSTVIRT